VAEASVEATKKTASQAKPGSKKKLIVLAGGLVALLVVAGGGFFAYLQFTEEPPPPPPKPKLAAQPATPQGQAVATAQNVVEQAKQQVAAPVNEILDTPPAAAATPVAGPATATPEPAAPVPEEVKPVAPPPPPPASVAFRGWVENLKIGGVRGGANPRIFVGGTSYKPGDLVNPQLGISFESYDEGTRMLLFKDKTGATVPRRH
jgi:hypothetical protein